MGLNCVFLAPNTRQRRKRTDYRVAELEKELKIMQRRLDDKESEGNAVGSGRSYFST
jgi:hypothetical protein